MTWLFVTLVIFVVIASVLLTIVVLLQSSKGEGMASNFIAGNQTLGVRQTADMLEKVTWGLVTFILVVSIVTSFTTGTSSRGDDISTQIENAATEQPAFPSAPVQQEAPATAAPATDAAAPATPAEPAQN